MKEMQFVARQLAGEPMAELCREFGISRKTGYKIFDRYRDSGADRPEPAFMSLRPLLSRCPETQNQQLAGGLLIGISEPSDDK